MVKKRKEDPTRLVKYDFVHVSQRCLTARFPSHTDEVLFQRHRSERGVEEEETSVPIYPDRGSACNRVLATEAAVTHRRKSLTSM
jgi:hypothetical protein